MSFFLKEFQEKAINELSINFMRLWKTGEYNIPLVFKAPTGSGKTIMMAEFLRCLDDNYQFHEDKAYLWISFGGDDSYSQSKNKLYQYFNEGTDMNLKDIKNLSEGKLYKNNIFFINWAKIKGTDKESKKLRKPNEHTEGEFGVFDEFIIKTKRERDLVLIIDEAHTERETKLANEVIDLIQPRIIIEVTATPSRVPTLEEVAGFVEVKEREVIESGLIKEKIIIQTQEDILKYKDKEIDEDEILLELAISKRKELLEYYKQLHLDINPLVLIQLPSDEQDKAEVAGNKKVKVLSYLRERGVKLNEMAIWLSNEKKNLELLEKNNNEVNFLLFKVAPATGWDCPRADVLVMFREIQNPTFHTQILGRIKRMPEGHHYEIPELNYAYLYTNYDKNHINIAANKIAKNKVPVFFTKRKQDIKNIKLQTTFHNRISYNTLSPEHVFQMFFRDFLDQYFNTSGQSFIDYSQNIVEASKKLNLTNTEVSNSIVVDAVIESFDNFVKEIKNKGSNYSYQFSLFDIERLYNLLCYDELRKQDNELAKFAPAKSWSALKKALNVWFSTRFGFSRDVYYKIIVNELLDDESNLKKAISDGLLEFRNKYDEALLTKKDVSKYIIKIPESEDSFTRDFSKMETKKNAFDDFYLRSDYIGRNNEQDFISFLDRQDIDWWHKQSDNGRGNFAVEYFNTTNNKVQLFYPDFIIRKDDKVYIVDTKSGQTAASPETADKNRGLQVWIKENQKNYKYDIIGGIVIFRYPNWIINRNEDYVYNNDADWELLTF